MKASRFFRIFARGLLIFPLLCLSKAYQTTIDEGRVVPPTILDTSRYLADNWKGDFQQAREEDQKYQQMIQSSLRVIQKKQLRGSKLFSLYMKLGRYYLARYDFLLRQVERSTREELEKAAKSQLIYAINIFRHLVLKFQRYPQKDQALLKLGEALLHIKHRHAVLYFKEIIKKYPKSNILGKAYLFIGDYFFYNKNYIKSIKFYKKLFNNKKNRVYHLALYKSAWSLYLAKTKSVHKSHLNLEEAINKLKKVISVADGSLSERNHYNLRRRAIDDLVMIWAEKKDTRAAKLYFTRIKEKKSFDNMLERLGYIYEKGNENRKSIVVYKRLLLNSDVRKNNPEIHMKIVDIYLKINNVNGILYELREIRKLYLTEDGKWYRYYKNDKNLINNFSNKIESYHYQIASTYHHTGLKKKKKKSLHAAAEIYQGYIDRFMAGDHIVAVYYNLATLEFRFRRFESASEYFILASQGKTKETEKFRRQAAESAVKAVALLRKRQRGTSTEKQKNPDQPLSKVEQLYIKALDNFISIYPEAPSSYSYQFDVAEALYQKEKYEESFSRFNKIIKNRPTSIQSKKSIRIILKYFIKNEKWIQLIEKCKYFIENLQITEEKFKKFLDDSLKYSLFKYGEFLESNGKFEKAAEEFERFQNNFQKDDMSGLASYKSILNYYKIGRFQKALRLTEDVFLIHYSRSKYGTDVVMNAAKTNETLGRFEVAAKYYLFFGEHYIKDKRSPVAFYQAANLYETMREYSSFVMSLEKFTQMYAQNTLYPKVLMRLAEGYMKINDYESAVKSYEKFYLTFRKDRLEDSLFARAKIADIMLTKLAHRYSDEGHKILQALILELKNNKKLIARRARQAVSKNLFYLLKSDFNQYMQMQFQDTFEIDKQIAERKGEFAQLIKKYQSIVPIGSDVYAVAVFYRIGEIYEHFANALQLVPVPSNLSEIEKNELKNSIEQQIFPFREKSDKFFREAYSRAARLESLSEWSQKAFRKMSEIDPNNFSDLEELSTSPVYLDHSLMVDKMTEQLTY